MTNAPSSPQTRTFFSAREKVISGIGTPLGFFALALLIVEGFLWGAGSAFDLPVDIRIYALWVGVGLFVLVLFVVVVLVVRFPQNLVFSEKSHLDAMAIYGAKEYPLSSIAVEASPLVAAPKTISAQAQISQIKAISEGGKNE